MTYFFDPDIAAEYGVSEAIMIQNFAYWIGKNAANGKHFYEGRYWTYNSVEAFGKLFPFWTGAQIRHILKNLIDKGAIVKGNFNVSQYDRTCWYAFSDSICEKYQLYLLNLTNGTDNSSRPIANINPDTNPDTSYRGTTEGLCLFSNSRFASFEAFKGQFQKPEYEGIDIYYYWQAVADWSAQGGKKKRDWIATARNFMRGDNENGKLHRIGCALSPDAVRYLEMGSKLFND